MQNAKLLNEAESLVKRNMNFYHMLEHVNQVSCCNWILKLDFTYLDLVLLGFRSLGLNSEIFSSFYHYTSSLVSIIKDRWCLFPSLCACFFFWILSVHSYFWFQNQRFLSLGIFYIWLSKKWEKYFWQFWSLFFHITYSRFLPWRLQFSLKGIFNE